MGGTNEPEKEAGSGTSPAKGKQNPHTLPFPRPTFYPYHARCIVGSHSSLKAMGAVDNDEALFSCYPQLLQQVWVGGPIPRAKGLHDYTLQWGLQEGPDLWRWDTDQGNNSQQEQQGVS